MPTTDYMIPRRWRKWFWRTRIPIFSNYLLDTTFFSQILHEFSYGSSFRFPQGFKNLWLDPQRILESCLAFCLFGSRLESIETDLGLMQQDLRVTDPMRRLFPYHFLSFPIHTVSACCLAGLEGHIRFPSQFPKTYSNHFHQRPGSSPGVFAFTRWLVFHFLFSIRVFLFFWSAFFPLQVEPFEFGLISSHILSSSQPLWVGRLIGCECVWFIRRPTNIDLGMCVLFFIFHFWKEARGKAVVELCVTSFLTYYVCMTSFEKNESCLFFSFFFFFCIRWRPSGIVLYSSKL